MMSSPSVSNITKIYPGPLLGISYPNGESLGIFAFGSDQPVGSWEDPDKEISLYIDGAEFKYNPEFGAWSGWGGSEYTPYFWPKEGSLIFAGYSPYRYVDGNPLRGVSFDVVKKELSIENFQSETYVPMPKADFDDPDIDYKNTTQSDLMYFLPEYDINGNYSGSNNLTSYSPVMNHALSLLVFTVSAAQASDIDYIDLNSITLHSVYRKGDLKVKMNGTLNGQTQWDFTDESPSDMSVFDAGNDGAGNPDGLKLDTNPRTIAELLIIPGITHDISVKYRLHVNGRIVMETMKISPTDIDLDPDPNSVEYLDKWEIGKKYIYNIKLGVGFISVNPSVFVWSENVSN